MRKPTTDWTNKEIERLVVKEYMTDGPYRGRWRCECKCGKETFPTGYNLKNGSTKSCGCLGRENLKKALFKGHKELGMDYWRSIKDDAASRGIPVLMTIEQAYDLFAEQNWTCPYTGRKLDLGPLTKGNKFRNCSLDRIDSGLPYTPANCEWVWKPLNCMKRMLSNAEFIRLAGLVANPDFTTPAVWTPGALTKTFWYRITSTAFYRDHPVTVSMDEAQAVFDAQGGRCAITGLPISFPTNSSQAAKRLQTASLDRIDSARGYEAGNIQWLHVDVNLMKRSYSQEEFVSMCREIDVYCRANPPTKAVAPPPTIPPTFPAPTEGPESPRIPVSP